MKKENLKFVLDDAMCTEREALRRALTLAASKCIMVGLALRPLVKAGAPYV